jgi:hypothetical protein
MINSSSKIFLLFVLLLIVSCQRKELAKVSNEVGVFKNLLEIKKLPSSKTDAYFDSLG